MNKRPAVIRMERARALVEAFATMTTLEGSAAREALASLHEQAKDLATEFAEAKVGYSDKHRKLGISARLAATDDFRDYIFPIIRQYRKQGYNTIVKLADAFNRDGIVSFTHKKWRPSMVYPYTLEMDAKATKIPAPHALAEMNA